MEKIICWLKGIGRSFSYLDNHPISGHLFVDKEEHENCRVIISECETCGEVDVSWSTGDNKYR